MSCFICFCLYFYRRLDDEIRTAIRGQAEVGHDGRQVCIHFLISLVYSFGNKFFQFNLGLLYFV